MLFEYSAKLLDHISLHHKLSYDSSKLQNQMCHSYNYIDDIYNIYLSCIWYNLHCEIYAITICHDMESLDVRI